MDRGIVGSMHECGVTESYKLKRQVVLSASEAAEMILRVDDSEWLMRKTVSVTSADQRMPTNSSEVGTEATGRALIGGTIGRGRACKNDNTMSTR